MKKIKEHLPLIAVITVAAVMLLPWLGLTDFNTKGEPREAVVALSMIKDGDWILPVNNGMDIPYKPPFFHYCIAVVSLLAGSVNEYTSRLPSAVALIVLAAACFAFYRRRMSSAVALTSAILLLTAFEVHRAGINCRVDMVLTAFTVGAMLLLYRWWERGRKGVPIGAILCMSCATLTKGPVGFVLPCFVMGVFTLLRGGKFWSTLLTYIGFGLLSCILPAVWYIAAWHEGGQHFLDLVYEENIGRMTGTMSYDSHVHAFPYNFMTLATGWLPWTLLLLFSLAVLPWKAFFGKKAAGKGMAHAESAENGKSAVERLTRLRVRIMQIPPVELFTWLGFVLVLFFYCLPSSKRSVYLLPCYPFMAVLIAQYVEWLWREGHHKVLRSYTWALIALSLALGGAFLAVRLGAVPDTVFHGKHAAENIAMLHALRYTPLNIWTFTVVMLPVLASLSVARDILCRKTRDRKLIVYYGLFAPVVLLFIALDGFYQPVVLNTKSLRPLAEYIAKTFPGEPLYQYVGTPMMHFFGADYYLGDTMAQFETPVRTVAGGKTRVETKTPEKGVLVISENDFADFAKRHAGYRFALMHTTRPNAAEVKGKICLYRFEAVKH